MAEQPAVVGDVLEDDCIEAFQMLRTIIKRRNCHSQEEAVQKDHLGSQHFLELEL